MGGLLTAPGGKLLKVWSSSEMETPAGMGFPWDQEFVLFPVFFSACDLPAQPALRTVANLPMKTLQIIK